MKKEKLIENLEKVIEILSESDKYYQERLKHGGCSYRHGLCYVINHQLDGSKFEKEFLLNEIFSINFPNERVNSLTKHFWWYNKRDISFTKDLYENALVIIEREDWYKVRIEAVKKVVDFYKNLN